jgi:hypothetical protein
MERQRVRRRLQVLWVWALPGALALLVIQSPAQASENYVLFRVDTGLFFAYGHGPGRYGGGAFVEPKFAILDPLVVGAHLEGVVMGGGSINPGTASTNPGTASTSVEMRGIVNFLAKAEWYFLDSPIRPFVGFGLGVYDIAGQSIATSAGGALINQKAGSYFGLAPQAGIELGIFRLSLTYNAIIGAAIEVQQTVGTSAGSHSDVSQNYLSVDLGFRIGGWRRQRRPPPPPMPPPVVPALAPGPAAP